MCEKDGYKTVTPIQLCNILSAYDEKLISLIALRVYFGCLELIAIREAASRSSKKKFKRGEQKVRFQKKELLRLVSDVSDKSISRALKELTKAGLLSFSESEILITETVLPFAKTILEYVLSGRKATRPIPVARKILQYLSQSKKPALTKTIVAYLLRGLTLDRKTGEVRGKGTVKISWICEAFNISDRAAKTARAELIKIGWISKDENSFQRKLNRDGAYFVININWNRRVLHSEEPKRRDTQKSHSVVVPVDNSAASSLEFSPLTPQKSAQFSPPIERLKTSYEYKNQKTQRTEPAGVCKTKKTGENKPRIYDVTPEDLGSFSRVEELFFQAAKRGLIEPTEAGAVNFLAAAVRAKTVSGDAPRVFMGIVRGKLWKNITQADEDRALAALRRFRADNPDRFRCYASELKEAA